MENTLETMKAGLLVLAPQLVAYAFVTMDKWVVGCFIVATLISTYIVDKLGLGN